MSIKVLRPGLLTTIQDLGRFGLQKYGVIAGGAMDSYALRVANLLVGNGENEAALEITMTGPSLLFEEVTLLAITGGDLSAKINGEPVPRWRPIITEKGSALSFGGCIDGCRAYLAVAGGVDIPKIMGSASTYLRAGIGGFEGRVLKEGDILKAGEMSSQSRKIIRNFQEIKNDSIFYYPEWAISSGIHPDYQRHPIIRITEGGQFEDFTADSIEQFLQERFQVTPQSDRMGYRLAGPKLQLSEAKEMISEAVSAGTIQVPSEGNPIILMADRQTTGGYPKIGHVISVDIPVLAQVKPGDYVRFKRITVEEAQELYVLRETEIQLLKQGIALH